MIQGEIEEKMSPPYWTASHFLFTPQTHLKPNDLTASDIQAHDAGLVGKQRRVRTTEVPLNRP